MKYTPPSTNDLGQGSSDPSHTQSELEAIFHSGVQRISSARVDGSSSLFDFVVPAVADVQHCGGCGCQQ